MSIAGSSSVARIDWPLSTDTSFDTSCSNNALVSPTTSSISASILSLTMADVPYMSPSPSTEQLPQHTDTSASISTATPAAESTPVTQPPSTLPSDQQSTAARQRKAASTPSRKKSSASSKSKKAGAAGGSASKKAEEHPYGTAPLKVLHQGLTLWAKTKSQPWWPCEVFPPELAPEGIQRARPTGRSSNDQILVNYFGESGGFNWIKNSRAALLHVGTHC